MPTEDELRDHAAACAECERLNTAIETEERFQESERAEAEAEIGGGAGGGHGTGARDARPEELREMRRGLAEFARTGNMATLNAISARALSGNVDDAGGYTIVPALSATMTRRLHDQSPMRRLARVVQRERSNEFVEPIDREEPTASWVTENQARPETTTPTFGLLKISLNEIYATQPITQALLDSSYVDLGGWIEEKITDKFARTEGTAFVVGDSVLKPQGFLTLTTSADADSTRDAEALQKIQSGAPNGITVDALRDMFWKLRAPHRTSATWLMSSATANAIDKLKDGNGDYLWRDSSVAGVPPTLLGRPVEFSEDMPAPTTGQLPVAFGDWMQGYVIVDQVGVRFLRDPYTSKPNVLFYAYKRVAGGVANCDAIKLLEID
jgi:HK97 family phage major capsid protein